MTNGIDIADLPENSEIWRDFLECRLPVLPGPAEIGRVAKLADSIKQKNFSSSEVNIPPGSVAIVANISAVPFGGPLSQLLKCLTAVKICAEFEKNGVVAAPVCCVREESPQGVSPREIYLVDRSSKLHCLNPATSEKETSTSAAGGKCGENFIKEAAATPSGFAGNAGFRPHFSRICGQDARAPRGFALSSKEIIPGGDEESFSELNDAFASGADLVSSCARWFRYMLKDFGAIVMEQGDVALDRDSGGAEPRFLRQSRILPVAVFVVDSSEIVQYVNTLPQWESEGTPYPLIWPCPDVTISNARNLKTLKRYGLDFTRIFEGRERVIDYARGSLKSDVPARLQKLRNETCAVLEELETAILAARDERSERIRKTRVERIIYQLEKIRRHSHAALVYKEKTAVKRISRACDFLTPLGRRQKDALCAAQIPVSYGRTGLRVLYERLDITTTDHQLIEIN